MTDDDQDVSDDLVVVVVVEIVKPRFTASIIEPRNHWLSAAGPWLSSSTTRLGPELAADRRA
jgi:hypothetical protein